MESGVWQPQPSGLPVGNFIMDWLDPALVSIPEGPSLAEGTTLACNTVGPGSAEYVACNIQDSLLSRNTAALIGFMADPFNLGYWFLLSTVLLPKLLLASAK